MPSSNNSPQSTRAPTPPTVEFNPAELSHAERYKLMVGAIVPRPIGFISTVDREGRHNLAPYSFFNGVGAEPWLVSFCPANDLNGAPKHSLTNALPESEGGTGCFVVNIASYALARQVAAAGEDLPQGESEFELTGLTPTPSHAIPAPRVAEAPFGFECRTEHVLRFADGTPGGANLVVGRVVHAFAHEGLVNDRLHIDPARLDAIARMGGPTYARTTALFDLPRGRAALNPSQ